MAKSAERLALVTKSTEALGDAERYKTLALEGMRKAIDSLSRDNADAVLCAFILLEHRTSDW